MRPSAILWSDKLQQHEFDSISLVFRITAATTASFYASSLRPDITFGYNAAGVPTDELGQTTIDNLIGPNIITAATSFGATAMGANIFGFVLSTKKQLLSLEYAEVTVLNSATAATTFQAVQCLPYSLTNYPNTLPAVGQHRIGITSTGDAVGIISVTGLDAIASGFIKINMFGKLK